MHLPKLVGALVVAGALLMFFGAIINLFEAVEAVNLYPTCIATALSDSTELEYQKYSKIAFCKDEIRNATGFYPISEYFTKGFKLSPRETVAAFLQPIANVFWWLALMLVGTVLYRSGDVVVPIEESEKMVRDRVHSKK